MVAPELIARRKAEDREFFLFPERWPLPAIHVKTQPWVEGERQFGLLLYLPEIEEAPAAPEWQVLLKDPAGGRLTGDVEAFPDVDDLAERWSPD